MRPATQRYMHYVRIPLRRSRARSISWRTRDRPAARTAPRAENTSAPRYARALTHAISSASRCTQQVGRVLLPPSSPPSLSLSRVSLSRFSLSSPPAPPSSPLSLCPPPALTGSPSSPSAPLLSAAFVLTSRLLLPTAHLRHASRPARSLSFSARCALFVLPRLLRREVTALCLRRKGDARGARHTDTRRVSRRQHAR